MGDGCKKFAKCNLLVLTKECGHILFISCFYSGLTQAQDENTTSSGVCEQLLEDRVSLTSGHLNLHPDITNPECQQPHSQLISITSASGRTEWAWLFQMNNLM